MVLELGKLGNIRAGGDNSTPQYKFLFHGQPCCLLPVWSFRYNVTTERRSTSDYLIDEDNTPDADSNLQYIPVTYYSDGRMGNDIQNLNKEEIIADVFREYERYLSVVSDEEKAIMFIDKEKYKS